MDTIDRPAPATAARVVVAEGVWGTPLEQLGRVHDVVRLNAGVDRELASWAARLLTASTTTGGTAR